MVANNIRDIIKNSTEFTQTLDQNKDAIIRAPRADQPSCGCDQRAGGRDRRRVADPTGVGGAGRPARRPRQDVESLDRLGGVATEVIRKSKEDTITDLRLLRPVLEGWPTRRLADRGSPTSFPPSILRRDCGTRRSRGSRVPRRRRCCSRRRLFPRLHQPRREPHPESRTGADAVARHPVPGRVLAGLTGSGAGRRRDGRVLQPSRGAATSPPPSAARGGTTRLTSSTEPCPASPRPSRRSRRRSPVGCSDSWA